jgi:hypothetical protein
MSPVKERQCQSTSAGAMSRWRRGLLIAITVLATAFGAVACGPTSHPHPKKSTMGPAGY